MAHKQPFALTQAESGYRDLQHKELFMVKSKQVPDLGLRCLQAVADHFCWDWAHISTLVEPVALPEHGQNDSVVRLVNYHPIDNSETGIDTDIHEDLGLFTFVLPTCVPALEVYDFVDGQGWIDVEAQQAATDVIVMAGESLCLLSQPPTAFVV